MPEQPNHHQIIEVVKVHIPAMSTIGYGYGFVDDEGGPDEGRSAVFVGDHRAIREIGETLADGEGVVVDCPVIVIGDAADEMALDWPDPRGEPVVLDGMWGPRFRHREKKYPEKKA